MCKVLRSCSTIGQRVHHTVSQNIDNDEIITNVNNVNQDHQYVSFALTDIGCKLLSKGANTDAVVAFDAALVVLSSSSHPSSDLPIFQYLHQVQEKLRLFENDDYLLSVPPDNYSNNDDSDVGPRLLLCYFPCFKEGFASNNFLKACILYNKALAFHLSIRNQEAAVLYKRVISIVQSILDLEESFLVPQSKILEIGVRAYNNLGQICYCDACDNLALSHFEAALSFARRLALTSKDMQLVYSTVLSNSCRVFWMNGDLRKALYDGLLEVLNIRLSYLEWDSVDVATAHHNLGLVEYAKGSKESALFHLKEYLLIVAYQNTSYSNYDLDPIPATIYVLLLESENNDDSISQQLVQGLRELEEEQKNPKMHNSDIARLLNLIGMLLSEKENYYDALLFFREELRFEEIEMGCEDVRLCTTCNNIGVIYQKLQRLPEAIQYYERALKCQSRHTTQSWLRNSSGVGLSKCTNSPSATMELCTSVLYNLGLVYNEIGSSRKALVALQECLKLQKMVFGVNHTDVARLLYSIGILQLEQKMVEEATFSMQEFVRIRDSLEPGEVKDEHLVMTLKTLLSLVNMKGSSEESLDLLRTILMVQQRSSETGPEQRQYDMGITLGEMARIYHEQDKLSLALETAKVSANMLLQSSSVLLNKGDKPLGDNNENCCVGLVSALILLGGLTYENSDQMNACMIFAETIDIIDQFRETALHDERAGLTSGLDALREICCMLAIPHCASMA